MNEVNNTLFLNGKLLEMPVFDHETPSERFYTAKMAVTRLSGTEDILPVTISETILKSTKLEAGSPICFEGQIRTYNKVIDGASRLVVTCFVLSLRDPETLENPNHVELYGTICKPPQYRVTPYGREITDLLIAVNMPHGRSAYIPCIAWGFTARKNAHLAVGEKISVYGRLQSRNYEKTMPDGSVITRTTYEVSVIRASKTPTYSIYEEVRSCV